MIESAERLSVIISALESVGLRCLVMGGHAVCYYGLQRFTNDFDFALAPDGWDELRGRLARTNLCSDAGPIEGNSWRPGHFRRFRLGAEAEGREEWLEFWLRNHLLAPFPDLYAQRTRGLRRTSDSIPLTSRPHPEQGNRTSERLGRYFIPRGVPQRAVHALYAAGAIPLSNALAQLRSRRGFDTILVEGGFSDAVAVRVALAQTANPVTQAFLLPWAPEAVAQPPVIEIEPLVERKIRTITPASPLHRSLVEVVRRQYKVFCQERDMGDKQAIVATGREQP